MSTVPVTDGRIPTAPKPGWHAPIGWLRAVSSLVEPTSGAATETAASRVVLLAVLVLAAAVRFWGLGNVGLHGDEETMAMPTMHIVEHGTPLLPSGMFYPRGVAQLYLMAASVKVFGESEWAMRVPSALFGVLLVLVAWGCGRRFLSPAWNLALAGAVALLPAFIVDAQTARMYGFLVTCVAGYMWFLFRWERSDRIVDLVAAVAILVVGIQFHTLAVFAAFMAFFPGLLRGEPKKVLLGALAFAVIAASFLSIDHWIASQYPPGAGGDDEGGSGARAADAVPALKLWILAGATVLAAAIAAFAVRTVRGRIAQVCAGLLIAAGLVAEVAFSWHLALLLAVGGLVVAYRSGSVRLVALAPIVVFAAAVAAFELHAVMANGVPSIRQAVGAVIGSPSIWPLLVGAKYSPVVALMLAGGIVVALWRLARRQPIPDFILLALLGVWIPLLLIGWFKWNVPLRYTAAQSFPLLLCGFACAQWAFDRFRATSVGPARAVVAAAAGVLVVNPVALSKTVNAGYSTNPDHKGAAEFIRSLPYHPGDILVAEDVLQQTYYLGHVNYWLESKDVAAPFVRTTDGVTRDFYTNTPLLGTAEDLEALIARRDRGAIYVIGSGENQEDGRLLMRGPGIARLLASPIFHEVYRGRDGLTTILKVSPADEGPIPAAADVMRRSR